MSTENAIKDILVAQGMPSPLLFVQYYKYNSGFRKHINTVEGEVRLK